MTILATGIGYLPQFRPTQRVCKHCGEPYLPLTRGDRYCRRAVCQEAKLQIEREKQRRRGH